MPRNIAILLVVCVLFGLALGLYDFVLPFLLDHWHMSFRDMGLVFGIAAIAMFFARTFIGDLSDRCGRKAFYAAACFVLSAASGLTPFAPWLALQALLKGLRDGAFQTFDSMHQLVLHDEDRKRYLRYVGVTRGTQYLAEAGGALLGGLAVATLAFRPSFAFSSVLFLFASLVFLTGYRTDRLPSRAGHPLRIGDVFALDLPRQLWLLTIANFVFTIGLSTSHCFVMQLYWVRRFAEATPTAVSAIMMLHRVTVTLPLLIGHWLIRSRLKETYVAFLALEGVVLAVSALIGHFHAAVVVWLTHDLVGAGVWIPIQSAFLQRLSRDGVRGRDVSSSLALASLGGIVGPIIAGAVFEGWTGGPFVISGLLMVASAVVLAWLRVPESGE